MPLSTRRLIAGSGSTPTQGPLPLATTLTGTMSSVGTVVTGVGSLFTKDLVRSDHLYNTSTNEVRKISGISGDTILILDSPFSSDMASQAVLMSRAKYVSIGITATGGGQNNNVAIASGQFLSFNGDGNIEPFTYSGSLTFDVGYIS